MQSVHACARLAPEPVRLDAFIEGARAAVEGAIAGQAGAGGRLDNG